MAAEKKWAIKQREFEFALNLLKRNRPIDEIMEDTGLTREEIENLRTNLWDYKGIAGERGVTESASTLGFRDKTGGIWRRRISIIGI